MKRTIQKLKRIVESEQDLYTGIYRGFRYVVLRRTPQSELKWNDPVCVGMIHLCGYVLLPKDHYLYGEDYDQINRHTAFDVHGGLTFSAFGDRIKSRYPEVDEKAWVIGFDLAHMGDVSVVMPGFIDDHVKFGESYKTKDYATEECKRLIDQLKQPSIVQWAKNLQSRFDFWWFYRSRTLRVRFDKKVKGIYDKFKRS